jgi:hypothetical protein
LEIAFLLLASEFSLLAITFSLLASALVLG